MQEAVGVDLEDDEDDQGQRWDTFVALAQRFRAWEGFSAEELDYKREIADRFAQARDALVNGNPDWLALLRRALLDQVDLGASGGKKTNNLIHWRVRDPFLEWCKTDDASAFRALSDLWSADGDPVSRLDRFREQVPITALATTGTVVMIGSALLLGVDGRQFPIYRPEPFHAAYKSTAFPQGPSKPPSAVYQHALDFLDRFIDEAASRDFGLSDRMEAQGVAWAVTQWKATDEPVRSWSKSDQQRLTALRRVPDDSTEQSPWETLVYWTHRLADEPVIQQDLLPRPDLLARMVAARSACLERLPEQVGRLHDAFGALGSLTGNLGLAERASQWLSTDPEQVVELCTRLWGNTGSTGERVANFCARIPTKVTPTTAQRLAMSTTLLQADTALDIPVYLITTYRKGFVLTGYDPPSKAASDAEIFEHTLGFLDRFIAEAAQRAFSIPNRIVARSLLWHVWHVARLKPEDQPLASWADRAEFLAWCTANTVGDLEESSSPRAWIFQSNPATWDSGGALQLLQEMTWPVRQHREDIHAGDRVYLWESGPGGGILAVGTLLSDPAELPQDADERPFVRNEAILAPGKLGCRVRLRVDRVLPGRIPRELLLQHTVLGTLPIFRMARGTNCPVDDAQATALAALVKVEVSPPVTFEDIMATLDRRGLRFSDEVVSSYLLALQSKRFVILTGISGTGKTQLALGVAHALQPTRPTAEPTAVPLETALREEPLPNYVVVAVRPDWTDGRGLLGFYNPLTKQYMTTAFLDFLLTAARECARAKGAGRPARPFFAILDEMNLAHVEHYFSDFLSCLESGEALDLHQDDAIERGEGDDDKPIPRRLVIPENVFFTGTVNVDETTYMFSPKVLDRAFTLELSEVDLTTYGEEAAARERGPATFRLHQLPPTFVGAAKGGPQDWSRFGALDSGRLRDTVVELHHLLEAEHRHFGYRVAEEIARFVHLAAEQATPTPESLTTALDLAILQKVLPKFHGTQQELEHILGVLLGFAVYGPGNVQPAVLEELLRDWRPVGTQLRYAGSSLDGGEVSPQLPRTARKLWRMLTRVRMQGFTSFIE